MTRRSRSKISKDDDQFILDSIKDKSDYRRVGKKLGIPPVVVFIRHKILTDSLDTVYLPGSTTKNDITKSLKLVFSTFDLPSEVEKLKGVINSLCDNSSSKVVTLDIDITVTS